MPIFQANITNSGAGAPAANMQAQQALQQIEGLAQDMEQRAVQLDLAERDMALSEQRAAEYAQAQQASQAFDQQAFDWQREYQQRRLGLQQQELQVRALSDPEFQAALPYLAETGQLTGLLGLDMTEPGAQRIWGDAAREAGVAKETRRIENVLGKAKEFEWDVEAIAQGLQPGGGLDLDALERKAQTETLRRATTQGKVGRQNKWLARQQQTLDLMAPTMAPELVDEAMFILSKLEGAQSPEDWEALGEDLDRLKVLIPSAEGQRILNEQLEQERAKSMQLMELLAQAGSVGGAAAGSAMAPSGVAGAAVAGVGTAARGEAAAPFQPSGVLPLDQVFTMPRKRGSAAGNRGEPRVIEDDNPEAWLKSNPSLAPLVDDLLPAFEAAERGGPAEERAWASALAERGLAVDERMVDLFRYRYNEKDKGEAEATDKKRKFDEAANRVRVRLRNGAITPTQASKALKALSKKYGVPIDGDLDAIKALTESNRPPGGGVQIVNPGNDPRFP